MDDYPIEDLESARPSNVLSYAFMHDEPIITFKIHGHGHFFDDMEKHFEKNTIAFDLEDFLDHLCGFNVKHEKKGPSSDLLRTYTWNQSRSPPVLRRRPVSTE